MSTPPRVFISYSWTDEEYKQRVLDLATALRRDGVDAILDRWHLQPGHDAFAFMERSVTDPSVSKVLVLCDPTYAEKADGRQGGVGTETTIISPKVYGEVTQTKFLPVIMDRRGDDSMPLPAYLAGRLAFDLSRADREAEEYERLLRNLLGKPELVPPEVGRPPSYLDDTARPSVTGRALLQFRDAALRSRPQRWAYLDDYLARLLTAYDENRPPAGFQIMDQIREHNLKSIEAFGPYRDEFVEALTTVTRFANESAAYDRLHKFFERVLARLFDRSASPYNYPQGAAHLGFLARELMLHAVAVLLEAEVFDGLGRLISPYYVADERRDVGRIETIEVFDPDTTLIDELPGGYRESGYVGHLLAERATAPGVGVVALREAEFVCAIRARVDAAHQEARVYGPRLWWPKIGERHWFTLDDLPIVVRLRDRTYRERFVRALGFASTDDAQRAIAGLPPIERASERVAWLNPEPLRTRLGIGPVAQ